MTDLFWLSKEQLQRIEHHFPLSHGVPRVDDQRVVSGIIFVLRNGLRWRDAPREYGPHKTLYNRFVRWARAGVWEEVFRTLSQADGPPLDLLLDSSHAKAHRCAAGAPGGPSSMP